MLLNCDSHCCEQMVAGSTSMKSCHQRQNCSPNDNVDLTNSQSASGSCNSSPEQNDQNRNSECQLITQSQHNKGAKRRNDALEGPASVILGSVSTNVSHQQQQQHQHQTSHQKCDGGSGSMTPQTNSGAPSTRCTSDKCSGYSNSSPAPLLAQQEHAQTSNMDTIGVKPGESRGNEGGGDEGCESCCETEDYDYESILTKILNEKKLALSKSSEVISFFQHIPRSKQTGPTTKTERQTS